MPDTVEKWWSSRLAKQKVPDETIDSIVRWVGKKSTNQNLWDLLVAESIEKLEVEKKKEYRTVQRDADKKGEEASKRYDKEMEAVHKLSGKASTDAYVIADDTLARDKKSIEREKVAAEKKLELDYKEKAKVLERNAWPVVEAYIKCIVPGAVIDQAHFKNLCPKCHQRREDRTDNLVEYNQICGNCAAVLPSAYVCICPLCNSGLSIPVSTMSGGDFDPLFELTPRVIAVYEDLDHHPAFTPIAEGDPQWDDRYTKWNSPEFRYLMACPICLYKWYIVLWLPPQIANEKLMCPVCGNKMKATGKRGKEGGEEVVCTNVECVSGDIGVIHGGEG